MAVTHGKATSSNNIPAREKKCSECSFEALSISLIIMMKSAATPSSMLRTGTLLVASVKEILHQQRRLILAIPPLLYGAKPPLGGGEGFVSGEVSEKMHFGSSCGAHIRHSLDHISKPLESCDVHYDVRHRETAVENDPEAAISEIDRIAKLVDELSLPDDLDRELTVHFFLNAEGDEGAFSSTLARELQFASHHAIHHNSFAKTSVADAALHLRIDLAGNAEALDAMAAMGVAPSTQKYNDNIIKQEYYS